MQVLDYTTFYKELFVLCDATPDSAWDVLSLIDQYYRRGQLSADLFQTYLRGVTSGGLNA